MKKRWIRLVLGTLIMLLLGLIYAWSVFVLPFEQRYGWSRTQTSGIFTWSIVFFVIGLLLSGALHRFLSWRQIMLFSAGLLTLGFLGCAYTSQLVGLYLFYGVSVGLGVGMANNALISALLPWFPDRRGLASGILTMGFGLGGFLLSGGVQALLARYSLSFVFLLLGILFGGMVALGSWIAAPPSSASSPVTVQEKPTTAVDATLGEMVRTSAYWYYVVWSCLILAGGLVMIGHAAVYAKELGATAGTAAISAGILSLFNGLGRLLAGWLIDRKGVRTGQSAAAFYLLLAASFLLLSARTGSLGWMLLGFVLTGLAYGGVPPIATTFVTTYYGKTHFAINYGAVSVGMIVSALLGPYLAATLYSRTASYRPAFLAMLVFGGIALLVSRSLPSSDKANQTVKEKVL